MCLHEDVIVNIATNQMQLPWFTLAPLWQLIINMNEPLSFFLPCYPSHHLLGDIQGFSWSLLKTQSGRLKINNQLRLGSENPLLSWQIYKCNLVIVNTGCWKRKHFNSSYTTEILLCCFQMPQGMSVVKICSYTFLTTQFLFTKPPPETFMQ